MLEFIIEYRVPINTMTADQSLNLRKYEVDDDEWVIAEKLQDILKVCSAFQTIMFSLCLALLISRSGFQRRNTLLFSGQCAITQRSDPCHGSH